MVFTFKQCMEKWLSVYQINKAVREGKLYKLETGIYSDSPCALTLEIIVAKYPYAIITMDTAFYYHGLTDVIPDDFCIATLESAKALQDTRVRQYYIRKDLLNIGVVTMERRGVSFKIYDKERMLIELLRFKNIYPYDYYKEILSNYRKQIYELDIERIQEYADIFPKRKMISEALSTEVF